jgi:hypothetical protein
VQSIDQARATMEEKSRERGATPDPHHEIVSS